jgi:outer membrane lipoprotein LolB
VIIKQSLCQGALVIKLVRLGEIFGLATLLASCAHTISEPDWGVEASTDISIFESRRLEVEGLANWDFNGRIAARNGNDGGQATIHWTREGDSHTLDLFGPFGGGAVHMEYGPWGAVLRDGKDNRFVRENEQVLLDEIVGWRVPVKDMNYWLFGIASRDMPVVYQLDTAGNLARLRQSGWEIEFTDYREHGDRVMPGSISAVYLQEASGEGREPGSVTVRLVNRDWSGS